MLFICICISVLLLVCWYLVFFYNNFFFDVGICLNYCFIMNYFKLLLFLYVYVYIFFYNLDYLRYIILFLLFYCVYCVKCLWLWCCLFVFKRFKEFCYYGIYDVIMCWFLWKEKKWVGFCCFKRCIRCILIKVFIILKKFICFWGVFNKMWFYIENVILIFYFFCFGFWYEIL